MDQSTLEGSLCNRQKELEIEVEELRQRTFELTSANIRLQTINDEATLEIEALNELLKSKEKEVINKPIIKNDDKDEFYKKEILDLEQALKESRSNAELLERELQELKNDRVYQLKTAQDAHDELFMKMAGFEAMKKTTDELHITIENLQKEKTEFNLKNKYLEERLTELQELLEAKSSEIKVANDALKELQDQNALLSSEIATSKCQPANDEQRGNSLFAEVEDRRQVMRANLHLMTIKCEKYKRLYVSQANEITALRAEKNRFKMSLLTADEKLEKKLIELETKYMHTINALKQELKDLVDKRPESPQIIPVSETDNNLKWVPVVVNKAREEANVLRKEKFELQCENARLSSEVLRTELRNLDLKKDCVKLEVEIDELRRRNDNKVSEEINSPPVTQPVKGVRFDAAAKEEA